VAFEFEKLDVYQKALNFADVVYKITQKFPDGERYGIISQLRRAVISISANIAEGSGRYHKKDFVQYLRISRSSAYECIPLFEISFRQKYVDEAAHNEVIKACNELARMLNALINSMS
jgi:four helix bundle protein